MCFGFSSVPEAPLPNVLLAAFMFSLFANVLSTHGSIVARFEDYITDNELFVDSPNY